MRYKTLAASRGVSVLGSCSTWSMQDTVYAVVGGNSKLLYVLIEKADLTSCS